MISHRQRIGLLADGCVQPLQFLTPHRQLGWLLLPGQLLDFVDCLFLFGCAWRIGVTLSGYCARMSTAAIWPDVLAAMNWPRQKIAPGLTDRGRSYMMPG